MTNIIDKLLKKKYINSLLFWLYFFYPKARDIHTLYLLYFFLPQKVLRINGAVPWPVHFTSRILFKKNIEIGRRSAPGMNANCYIQARNKIIIGNNLRMGPGVGLISSNHSEDDYDEHTDSNPIRIGSNVWIGMNSVVLPGVTIGDNVMIGANSVVTKDIPSDVVAAGNPCKPLRKKKEYKGFDYKKTNN
jgi:acetyltransferase-like isoleucine patch superfamily enzyme